MASVKKKHSKINASVTDELKAFTKQLVQEGRYQNESEVVRDALRLLQQKQLENFNAIFGDYPGAPVGEPTAKDLAAIRKDIAQDRAARRGKKAA
jgi:putative addiction module CopG family antidote